MKYLDEMGLKYLCEKIFDKLNDIEKRLETLESLETPFEVLDDGNGDLIITGITMSDDGNGNIMVDKIEVNYEDGNVIIGG